MPSSSRRCEVEVEVDVDVDVAAVDAAWSSGLAEEGGVGASIAGAAAAASIAGRVGAADISSMYRIARRVLWTWEGGWNQILGS